MTNYEQQLKALIDLIGYQKIVEHIITTESEQVKVGMQLSHDKDGVLDSTDENLINSL
jgi:hypothetical protein|tara:strand:+ start:2822 stop:2995 length:174 start_codon:yes stop_codon:yes gene_type:complete